MHRKSLLAIAALLIITVTSATSQSTKPTSVESWVTNSDRSALFQKQTDSVFFRTSGQGRGGGSTIIIDEVHQFQEIDGFGYALTGGSAELLMKMSQSTRSSVLQEIFAINDKNIGVSYIRLSIGSSDLNSFVFSYDDLKENETDPDLKNFSLAQDLKDVIPVMKEILAINPAIAPLAPIC